MVSVGDMRGALRVIGMIEHPATGESLLAVRVGKTTKWITVAEWEATQGKRGRDVEKIPRIRVTRSVVGHAHPHHSGEWWAVFEESRPGFQFAVVRLSPLETADPVILSGALHRPCLAAYVDSRDAAGVLLGVWAGGQFHILPREDVNTVLEAGDCKVDHAGMFALQHAATRWATWKGVGRDGQSRREVEEILQRFAAEVEMSMGGIEEILGILENPDHVLPGWDGKIGEA